MKYFPNQEITFQSLDISILDNFPAASAYTASLRDYVYASSFESDTEIIYHNHQYLDSKLLHYWLNRLKNSFFGTHANQKNLVPIFLFDFSFTDMMLLDKKYQAVSFPDMVIAIQNEESAVRVPFKCGNEPLIVDGRDVTREILGALVQTLWGVLPT